MKKILMLALVLSALAPAAYAGCHEVQSAIDAKLQAKGVRNFSLDVVAAADVGSAKVVGNCGGGKNLIVYSRGKSSASAAPAHAAARKAAAATATKPAAPAKPVPALGNY